jgi:hypothetical protein
MAPVGLSGAEQRLQLTPGGCVTRLLLNDVGTGLKLSPGRHVDSECMGALNFGGGSVAQLGEMTAGFGSGVHGNSLNSNEVWTGFNRLQERRRDDIGGFNGETVFGGQLVLQVDNFGLNGFYLAFGGWRRGAGREKSHDTREALKGRRRAVRQWGEAAIIRRCVRHR